MISDASGKWPRLFSRLEPEKAEPMVRFVLGHSQGAWVEMNRLTVAGEFGEALTIYLWLRAHLDTRWDRLPRGGRARDGGGDARARLMLRPLPSPSVTTSAPMNGALSNGCAMPVSVVPPLLKRRGSGEWNGAQGAPLATPWRGWSISYGGRAAGAHRQGGCRGRANSGAARRACRTA